MSRGWTSKLLAELAEPGPPLCVGYSGGADSSSLLHALAMSDKVRRRGLRALHVDHGLDPASADWAAAARRFCAGLDLSCDVVQVRVDREQGQGLEAAAREARYRAFATRLAEGEWLLLAQHRDDQAETVLLKLLRGAGPDALRGMRRQRPLGRGLLLRPLLDVSGRLLRDYAHEHALPVQPDPSNQDLRLSRNYLRHAIMPQLQTHWPHAVDSILHAARWCGEAADALEPAITANLQALQEAGDASLAGPAWLALAPALRVPVLHEWLRRQGLPAPSTAQREQLERQIGALPGRLPQVRWSGAVVHVWRQRLWATPPVRSVPAGWSCPWHGEDVQLPDGSRYRLDSGSTTLPPLELRLRQGGERIQLAGETMHRELRDLFQQGGLPPWRRQTCPLVHENGQLIAVGDRWMSARGLELFQAHGGRPHWRPASAIDSDAGLG